MSDPTTPQVPPAQQPAYAQPTYAPQVVIAQEVPGKTLGIVGLVFAFLIPLVGLILSAVAGNQSKKAGFPNGPAKAGLIISIILLVLWIIFWILYIALFATLFASMGTITNVDLSSLNEG